MILTNCSPERTGLTIEQVDKMLHSEKASKQAEVKSWCASCPLDIKRACLAQGFWTNDDNKRVALPGIFGGLTEKERKAML